MRVATPFKHVWFPLFFFIKLCGHSFLNTRKRESAVKLFRHSYVYFHSVNVAGLCLTIPGKLWHTTEMWWWGAHSAHHSASSASSIWRRQRCAGPSQRHLAVTRQSRPLHHLCDQVPPPPIRGRWPAVNSQTRINKAVNRADYQVRKHTLREDVTESHYSTAVIKYSDLYTEKFSSRRKMILT